MSRANFTIVQSAANPPNDSAVAPALDALPGTQQLRFTGAGTGVGEVKMVYTGLSQADAGIAGFMFFDISDTINTLILRSTNIGNGTENFYELWVFASAGSFITFRLRKRVAGVITTITQAVVGGILSSDTIEVRFMIQGINMKVDYRVTGSPNIYNTAIQTTDADIVGDGNIGFGFTNFTGGAGVARLDNVRIFNVS